MVSSSRNTIACILLIFCSTIHAYSQKSATASITGKITLKDKGVAGIVIIATTDSEVGPRTRYRGVTDQNGVYRISNLPAGKYELRPFMQAFVHNSDRHNTAIMVGDGEAIENINFTLSCGGVVTGKITDADGQPVIEQSVHLIPTGDQTRILRIVLEFFPTDDRGIYRIYGVPPGKYKVWTGQDEQLPGGTRMFFKKTFYPSVTDDAKAAIVEVTEGSEATNIDIVMARAVAGYKVIGRIIDGETGKPLPGLRYGVSRIHEGGSMSSVGNVATNALGEFKLESVLPGKYSVFLGSSENSDMRADALVFDVVDRDVTGLEMKTVKGATLSGVVVLEGVEDGLVAKQLRELHLYATVNTGQDDHGHVQPAQVNADGSFTLRGLRGGMAHIGLTSMRQRQFGIVRIERDGVVQPNEFSVKEREHVTGLRVVVQHTNGTLNGQVKLKNADAADFYISVQLSRLNETQVMTESNGAEVDSRGRFRAEGLAPGTYEVTVTAFPRTGGGSVSAKQEVTVTNNTVSEISFDLEVKKNQ